MKGFDLKRSMAGIGARLLMLLALAIALSGCDVHEFPDEPESVTFHLRLNYETDMTMWHHSIDGNSIIEQGVGPVYDNVRQYGEIKYIVRAYPISKKQRSYEYYTKEFVFSKEIVDGYDYETTLELPAGDYDIMVWSEIRQSSNDDWFYDASNFAEITLHGDYVGNTDYRDAFRGTGFISLPSGIKVHEPETLEITMQRPLAKYELIATDLQEFFANEIEYQEMVAASRGEAPPSRVDTDNYKVVFYCGYMPNTYNMNTDKPVDSRNIMFESKLDVLNDNEASLGFDYVFVNGTNAVVDIQVGFFDNEDREIALSELIKVPLLRSRHTILRGSFLIQKASGGLVINPGFNGPDIIRVIE